MTNDEPGEKIDDLPETQDFSKTEEDTGLDPVSQAIVPASPDAIVPVTTNVLVPTEPKKLALSDNTVVPPEIETHSLSQGQALVREIENTSLDIVDQRLLDVFLEETEGVNKAHYTQLMTEESITEILIKDPEWSTLSDEAKKFLGGPANNKTRAVYEKYSAKYTDFCKKKLLVPFSEVSMIEFMIYMNRMYSPGTLWSIYSCLNNYIQTRRRFKLQQYTRLKCVMKRLTDGYVPSKAKIFS